MNLSELKKKKNRNTPETQNCPKTFVHDCSLMIFRGTPMVALLRFVSHIISGVANGTSKYVGLGKFLQDLEISEAFLTSLEVSFLNGLFLLF